MDVGKPGGQRLTTLTEIASPVFPLMLQIKSTLLPLPPRRILVFKKVNLATALLVLGLSAGLSSPILAQTSATAAPEAAAPSGKEWRMATGEHWLQASSAEQRAYVMGILNLAMVEYQLSGDKPKHRTTVTKLVKGLDGMTLTQIVDAVDAYYKANPDKQQTPVVEVIWFQMVVPKVGPAKIKTK